MVYYGLLWFTMIIIVSFIIWDNGITYYHNHWSMEISGSDWLEVRTKCRAYVLGLNFRKYPQKIWPKMWYSTSILGSWNVHWNDKEQWPDLDCVNLWCFFSVSPKVIWTHWEYEISGRYGGFLSHRATPKSSMLSSDFPPKKPSSD